MINIIKGKEPIYETDNYDVILIGTSTHNMLSGSYQYKLKNKYPLIEKVNNKTIYGDLRKLGTRVTINTLKPVVSLMYICTYPNKSPFVKYDALEKCLKTANEEFKGKKVMSVIVGSTRFDCKGERDKCLEIIERCTPDLNLDLYDYDIMSPAEEKRLQNLYFKKLLKENEGNMPKIYEILKTQKEMLYKTYLKAQPTKKYF